MAFVHGLPRFEALQHTTTTKSQWQTKGKVPGLLPNASDTQIPPSLVTVIKPPAVEPCIDTMTPWHRHYLEDLPRVPSAMGMFCFLAAVSGIKLGYSLNLYP